MQAVVLALATAAFAWPVLGTCDPPFACMAEEKGFVYNIDDSSPIANQAKTPTKDEYEKALKSLDMDAVKKDMTALLADSKDFWPADFGNYGPFMVRLAWHCSGSYRGSDGLGGCGGGRQRFEPERSWPDNTNLDKARALLTPLKKKYGDALSWGDLFILAGTTALRDAGAPLKKMCFGRVDDSDGKKAEKLGPTALQAEKMPCKVNGKCDYPLGDTTLGLVYVNPEGPMANPDPKASSLDVRRTFSTMGHSDRSTVALIGGGHAVGKGHGACAKDGANGLLPKDAFKKKELPWQGQCGTGKDKGKGQNTVTAGFEGAWTTKPLQWDNEYFDNLLNKQWEKHKGPGGHWQWRIKDSDSKLMRLTADLSLLHDAEYLKLVKEFANDMDAFNEAFDEAWFDLTTTYGSGTWADNAKCDDGHFPESLRHVELPVEEKDGKWHLKPRKESNAKQLWMLNTDVDASSHSPPRVSSFFIGAAAAGMMVSAVLGFAFMRRSRQTESREIKSELEPETEQLVA